MISGLKAVGEGAAAIQPSVRLKDARTRDYAGIIIPCMMSSGTSQATPAEALRVVSEAVRARMPIAAQNASELLMPTGVHDRLELASSPGVVRDDFLVTSYNCPNQARQDGAPVDTKELVGQFVALMEGR